MGRARRKDIIHYLLTFFHCNESPKWMNEEKKKKKSVFVEDKKRLLALLICKCGKFNANDISIIDESSMWM